MYIPLGLCTVLGYTFPIVTSVVSHFGWCSSSSSSSSDGTPQQPEKLSAFGWACCFAGLAGIVLVVRPWREGGLGSDAVIGILLTTGSALCWAVQVIVIRNTRAEAHWLQVEMVTAVVHNFVMTPIAWAVQYVVLELTAPEGGTGGARGAGRGGGNGSSNTSSSSSSSGPQSGATVRSSIVNLDITTDAWLLCVGVGLLAFVGLGASTRGFQLEEAPRGAIIMYMEIPGVYAAQWACFGVAPAALEVCGVLVVLAACVSMTVEKLMCVSVRTGTIPVAELDTSPIGQDVPHTFLRSRRSSTESRLSVASVSASMHSMH
jgi:drug/metabolite transporter (DMT)-like permease